MAWTQIHAILLSCVVNRTTVSGPRLLLLVIFLIVTNKTCTGQAFQHLARFYFYQEYKNGTTISRTINERVIKQNILSIAKTAMKHFFDIDPVLKEHFVWQTAAQAQLLQQEVKHVLHHNIQQSKVKIIQLVHPEMSHNWNAAR